MFWQFENPPPFSKSVEELDDTVIRASPVRYLPTIQQRVCKYISSVSLIKCKLNVYLSFCLGVSSSCLSALWMSAVYLTLIIIMPVYFCFQSQFEFILKIQTWQMLLSSPSVNSLSECRMSMSHSRLSRLAGLGQTTSLTQPDERAVSQNQK